MCAHRRGINGYHIAHIGQHRLQLVRDAYEDGLNLVVMMPEALYEAIEGTAVR